MENVKYIEIFSRTLQTMSKPDKTHCSPVQGLLRPPALRWLEDPVSSPSRTAASLTPAAHWRGASRAPGAPSAPTPAATTCPAPATGGTASLTPVQVLSRYCLGTGYFLHFCPCFDLHWLVSTCFDSFPLVWLVLTGLNLLWLVCNSFDLLWLI